MKTATRNCIKIAISLSLLSVFYGCASSIMPIRTTRAKLGNNTAVHKELISLPPPKEKVVVAVYKFRDQTGQYKTSDTGASWSTAVTQGATSMLLKALEDCGWFITLEREGLANLLNERRIISSTRENFKTERGQSLPPLPPLLYAGITLEGGIISYETNTITGGFGAQYFGLGGHTEYRRDQITIYLRAVSTQNGRILKTVYTTKTILSKMVDIGLYRFVRPKRLLEVETGYSTNEPPQMCVLEAIEKAVTSLIIEGIAERLWTLKNPRDVRSPVIQRYFREKRDAAKYAQFDRQGNLVSAKENNCAAAVADNHLGIGMNMGGLLYQGDYANSQINPAGNFFIRYGISPYLSLALNMNGGIVGDRDYFKSEIMLFELQGIMTLLPRKRLTPFLVFGGSAFNYRVIDKTGNNVTSENEYSNWEPAVFYGVGLEYFTNQNLGLSVSFDQHLSFTDKLDGLKYGKYSDNFWGLRVGLVYYLY